MDPPPDTSQPQTASHNSVPSRASSSVQRTPRRKNHEAKRARGEISCAECRRLKMKCDKKIPCNTCVRRGCANICPNGSLSNGSGSRLILADTEVLHGKINQLSERVRLLEDALAVLQSTVSKDGHPLLTKELLRIKLWPELPGDDISSSNGGADDRGIVDTINAMGTLTIGDDGEAKYYGQSAGSELLLYAQANLHDRPTTDPAIDNTLGPGQVDGLTPLPWPRRPSPHDHTALGALESSLPPITRAWALCESYYAHASWNFCPVIREEFVNDIMSPIYSMLSLSIAPATSSSPPNISHTPSAPPPGTVANLHPHKFSILYLIFAIGALVDLTQTPYNNEAHKYFLLARNALVLRSILDSPAVETVQAVSLMSMYHATNGRKSTSESAWSIMSSCSKLAQSMGLHRDCAGWGLDAKTIQKRRRVFWELYTADVDLCLKMGRPPSIALAYVDCEFPVDEEESVDKNGETVRGFWAWRYAASKNLLGPILESTVQVRPPSYQTILDFDKKVRQTGMMPNGYSTIMMDIEDEGYRRPDVCMKGWVITSLRLMSMLYIHRSFFAQALLHYGPDALRSPYAPSYLAAYRCSSLIIKVHLHYFDRCPELFVRFGGFWTHAFSASVIMGLIVTKMPKSNMATNAFAELTIAVDLFEKGATVNVRAKRSLTVLQKLRMKAYRAYTESRMLRDVPSSNNGDGNGGEGGVDSSAESRHKDGEDELSLFGGQTRVLSSKFISRRWMDGGRMKAASAGVGETVTTPASSNSNSQSDTPESQISTPSSGWDARGGEEVYDLAALSATEYEMPLGGDVHPALMQYLSGFTNSQGNGDAASTASFATDPLNDLSTMMDWSELQFPESFEHGFNDSFMHVQGPPPGGLASDLYSRPFLGPESYPVQDSAMQFPPFAHNYEYSNSNSTSYANPSPDNNINYFVPDPNYPHPHPAASTTHPQSQAHLYNPDAEELLEAGMPSGDQAMDSRMDRNWIELMKGSGLLDDYFEAGVGQQQDQGASS